MSTVYGAVDYTTLPAALLPLAKQHLRVDFSDDDTSITAYIKHAISRFERYSGWRVFGSPVVWTPYVPSGAASLACPVQPVSSFTASYAETDVTADYQLDAQSSTGPLLLSRKDGTAIPPGIILDLAAGYADAAKLDPAAENIVLLITGSLYEYRESVSAASPDLMPMWMSDLLVGTWIPRA
jgi:uncharacterized phiE125 gp8 family phage protein